MSNSNNGKSWLSNPGVLSYTLGTNTAFTAGVTNKFSVGATNSAFLGGQNTMAMGVNSNMLFGSSFSSTVGGTAVNWTTADTLSLGSGGTVAIKNSASTQAKDEVVIKAGLAESDKLKWEAAIRPLTIAKRALGALLAATTVIGAAASGVTSEQSENNECGINSSTPKPMDRTQICITASDMSLSFANNIIFMISLRKLTGKISELLKEVPHVSNLIMNADRASLKAYFPSSDGTFEMSDSEVKLGQTVSEPLGPPGRGRVEKKILKSRTLTFNSDGALLSVTSPAGPNGSVMVSPQEVTCRASATLKPEPTDPTVTIEATKVTTSNGATTVSVSPSQYLAKVGAATRFSMRPTSVSVRTGPSAISMDTVKMKISCAGSALSLDPSGSKISGLLIRLG